MDHRLIGGGACLSNVNLTMPLGLRSHCQRCRGCTNTDRLPDQQRMAQAPTRTSIQTIAL